MNQLIHIPQRLFPSTETDAARGRVSFDPMKGPWFLFHMTILLIVCPFKFSWDAIALMLVFTGVTICCGHSVGMHRLLIHRSFQCPRWLEHLLVYLGTLVGMGGPARMIALHEIRDWAQKELESHAFFGHGASWWRDAWWQLCCRVRLTGHPDIRPEHRVTNDAFYRFLDRTWMGQQIPVAVVLWMLGGWSFVVWGISGRIVLSLVGHWLVGYLAHNGGEENWRVEGASVQGYNVTAVGLISMGEGWHNNHHAFPRSARLGLGRQADPGWWFLLALRRLGLAWDLQTPETLPARPELSRVGPG